MSLRVTTIVFFALILLPPPSARALLGPDVVPAATLLVPYFEVQLPKKIGGKPKGVTTQFTINNLTNDQVLTHVTIWSDLAVPVLDFNVALTGYDVQAIDLQQVLTGQVPATGNPGGLDCEDFLPPFSPLSLDTVGHVRALLTGKQSPLTSLCGGLDHGDLIARGYVTVDVVNKCSGAFPGDVSYFAAAGTGVAANTNAIWGDAFIIDRQKKLGIGNSMVHIEAFPAQFNPGDQTFYGRYSGGDASDAREPLSSLFGVRYHNIPKDKLFPQGTTLLVWRDTQTAAASQFACGTTPAWYPLTTTEVVTFDEQENAFGVAVEPSPFAAATGRVEIGGASLPVAPVRGWLYMNLDLESEPSQAVVTVFHESKGRNSVIGPSVSLN
jgi:hypothetical protein